MRERATVEMMMEGLVLRWQLDDAGSAVPKKPSCGVAVRWWKSEKENTTPFRDGGVFLFFEWRPPGASRPATPGRSCTSGTSAR